MAKEKCVCSSVRFNREIRKGLITNPDGSSSPCDIPMGVCKKCGVLRQMDLPFLTETEYDAHYAEEYPPGNESYIHCGYNPKSGRNSFDLFKLAEATKVLDVGCGGGSTVKYCNDKGIEAYGCELVKYKGSPDNPNIYYRKFEDIYFPTDNFDRIVCSDVLEHTLDPVAFLKEMFRVLSIGGTAFLEVPNFFDPHGGETHWKRNEHVWWFTPEQFEALLLQVGFHNIVPMQRAGAKLVFAATKPPQHRTSLLLPPGIGDVYWTLVKTQALLKREGIEGPVDAYVAAPRAKEYDSHERSFPYLNMIPFLHSTGEVRFNHKDTVWKEAYLQQKRSVFKDVQGCDLFATWNGHQRVGKTLEEVDPDLTCNWHFPRHISLREEAYRKSSIDRLGNYILFYFIFTGTNGAILNHYPLQDIAQAINDITIKTGFTPVLVGAEWDLKDDAGLQELAPMLPENTVNLLGQTTLEEVFGLIRGASGVVGMNSGITLMAAELGVPTVMLIHSYLYTGTVDRQFAWNTVAPDVKRKTFFAEFSDETSPLGFVDRAVSLIGDNEFVPRRAYKQPAPIAVAVEEIAAPVLPNGGAVSIRDLEVAKPSPSSVSIMCVLKSGGDFTSHHVRILSNMLSRNVTIPYTFICLSDIAISVEGCQCIPLQHDYPRYWSKIEMFRSDLTEAERIVYFDLDTVITANIDDILQLDHDFLGLRPWNMKNRKSGLMASGMMSWKNGGSYKFLSDEFNQEQISNYPKGDQQYTSLSLIAHAKLFNFFQSFTTGIYSYKRNCRNRLPEDAKVVCFHGNPRPQGVKEKWVLQHWK